MENALEEVEQWAAKQDVLIADRRSELEELERTPEEALFSLDLEEATANSRKRELLEKWLEEASARRKALEGDLRTFRSRLESYQAQVRRLQEEVDLLADQSRATRYAPSVREAKLWEARVKLALWTAEPDRADARFAELIENEKRLHGRTGLDRKNASRSALRQYRSEIEKRAANFENLGAAWGIGDETGEKN
jgi:chromosome segregation ATPase